MAELTQAQQYLEAIEQAALTIPTLLMDDLERSLVARVQHVPGDTSSTAFRCGEAATVLYLKQLRVNARLRNQGQQH